jgi:predicted membrane protein
MPAKVSRVYGIHLRSSLFFGVIVVCIGAIFLLDNLHLVEADRILPWWPALLIGLGFAKLLDPSLSGTRVGAIIWILVGSLLLASNLDLIPWSIGDLWPVLLILFGAWIAMRGFGLGRPRGDQPEPQAVMNDFAMMAGLTRKNSSKEFQGGEATAIMGGAEIDLSEAELAGGEAVLDLFAMWGGIDIIVPGDWMVENRVTPLLGGVEDSRKTVGKDPAKRLVLRGFAVMGGIEISN